MATVWSGSVRGQRVIRLRLNQKGNETKNKKKDAEIPI